MQNPTKAAFSCETPVKNADRQSTQKVPSVQPPYERTVRSETSCCRVPSAQRRRCCRPDGCADCQAPAPLRIPRSTGCSGHGRGCCHTSYSLRLSHKQTVKRCRPSPHKAEESFSGFLSHSDRSLQASPTVFCPGTDYRPDRPPQETDLLLRRPPETG